MASSYALPASAMTHGHSHGPGHLHSHSHSQSHSPGRQYSANAPVPLKSERSNGSLHSQSLSESYLEPEHTHSHHHNHNDTREPSPSRYLPTPPNSNGLPPVAAFEKQAYPTYELSPALSQVSADESPLHAVNIISHDHKDHGHSHNHTPPAEHRSRFTNFLLPHMLRWPLLHAIMSEKDSRRIFYFMTLNFVFMVVQACYGYLTESLGLLSDSIHMFFDCLALGVGLFAAVASKWPPSERFPYGFGKIESLSGFGNGVFLILISVEIMIEATERLANGRETKRLMELFVVSALGLAINLIGMACFGHHGHAGHDHGGHSHVHSHSHSYEKPHSHDDTHYHHHEENCQDHKHDHGDSHSNSHGASLLAGARPSKGHAHSHSHDNENMHGIFLHVLADTMGSAAVMVSTALIHLTGFNGWDPLGSCVIAILIFMSSVPLIKSSARKLLLTVPDETEYLLRDTLSGVSDIRGVSSYSVPRFWVCDGITGEGEKVLGVMHVVATRGSELDEVRDRINEFLVRRGVDVVVQVEKDGGTGCWCGGGAIGKSPLVH